MTADVDLTPDDDADRLVATVELRGKFFAVRDQGVSLLALMKLATIGKRARQNAAAVDEMDALAAVYEMLRSAIAESDWQAFEDHANDVNADTDELQKVIADAVAAHQRAQQAGSARPTRRVSGSPGGPSRTAASSAAGSSPPASSTPAPPDQIRRGDVRVQHRLEDQGRPDLALVVLQAREASTATSTR